MVSSTMDNKKSQHKDSNNLASPSDNSNNNNSNNNSSGVSNDDSFLPPTEKLSLLFPKCRPRNDANLNNQTTASTSTTMLPSTSTVTTMKTTSMLSSSQSASNLNSSSTSLSQSTSYNTQSNNNIENNNISTKQLKLSPEHNKNCQHSLVTTQIEQRHENYVETNPFRIGNNSNNTNSDNISTNRYDRYYYYNSNCISNNNNMMHPHHHPSSCTSGYGIDSENKNFYLEPDEVEHNPYLESNRPIIATIPSSILATSPPATPPALTTTPTDLSPIASNRHLWDLSPIKTTTPTKIKNQSPTGAMYSGRSLKSSFKKRMNSSDEENFERNSYFYSKKSLYQPSQLLADNIELNLNDSQEMSSEDPHLYSKIKSSSRNRLKQSESIDGLYGDAKKKDERKIVKSKSGSGIIEYDGSPRRIGMASNDDPEYYLSSNYKFLPSSSSSSMQNASSTQPCPSPPRPGFPQRVLSVDQQIREKSPIMAKSYSFEDQKQNYTMNTNTIQTTMINSNIMEEPNELGTASNYPLDDDNSTNRQMDIPNYEDNISAIHLQASSPTSALPATSTFDYLYEFSETRKVLEEFFKCPTDELASKLEKFSDFNESDVDSLDIQYDYRGQIEKDSENMYGQQAMELSNKHEEDEEDIDEDNREDNDEDDEDDDATFVKSKTNGFIQNAVKENQNQYDYYLDSISRSSNGDNIDRENDIDVLSNTHNQLNKNSNHNNNYKNNSRRQSKNFHYSPDTTDYDSNYGDFDSESSLRFLATEYGANVPIINPTTSQTIDMNCPNVNNYGGRYYTSMPVLEDGLSSGHTSDTENNNNNPVPTTTNDYNYSIKRNNTSNTNNTSNNNGLLSTSFSCNLQNSPVSYQDNLVQTNNIIANNNNNNNNVFYGNTNSNNTTKNNNGNDIDDLIYPVSQCSMQQTQPVNHYYTYCPMRNEHKDNANSNVSSLINSKIFKNRDPELESLYTINTIQLTPPPPAPVPHRQSQNLVNSDSINPQPPLPPPKKESDIQAALKDIRTTLQRTKALAAAANTSNVTSPTMGYSNGNINNMNMNANCNSYYDRNSTIVESKESPTTSLSPVWIPRSCSREKNMHSPVTAETGLLSKHKNLSGDEEDEEDLDTDLETDRLLGHQRLDDGFYDDKMWGERKHRYTKLSPKVSTQSNPKVNSTSMLRHGLNSLLPTTTTATSPDRCNNSTPIVTSPTIQATPSIKNSPSLNSANMMNFIHPASTPDRRNDDPSPRKLENLQEQMEQQSPPESTPVTLCNENPDVCNIDPDIIDSPGGSSSNKSKKDSIGDKKKKNKNKEVLIEGVLFRARYLGSTQLVCEGQPTKSTRMMQAEEAVSRIKALSPDGENQPSTEVDLFISTEKIMVLNTDLKEIMMDHALRTISYIADIGDLVVLMARRRFVPQDVDANNSDSGTGTGGSGNVSGGSGGPTPPTSGGKVNRTPKMICHVFESEEAQFIAQSIGQAFQVAYMEFLKANGIEDHSFMKEMDYQEVLNSQEIFGDELEIFAKKELQKEVVVPKAKGEILGVVIVESGWGSMLPTVVIANLASNGAAARCGQLNIGDQIIAINGLSLVGLPLSQCQSYIKNTKNQTVVKFTVVPCAPVVEVKIKRPNTKYQLGFSVQNGVICSLLRGGIAERGGVRVGHRIIEINNQSVVAVPHEKIVNLLATSVGEILMKTMPTSMFRLLTGQENPIYI